MVKTPLASLEVFFLCVEGWASVLWQIQSMSFAEFRSVIFDSGHSARAFLVCSCSQEIYRLSF